MNEEMVDKKSNNVEEVEDDEEVLESGISLAERAHETIEPLLLTTTSTATTTATTSPSSSTTTTSTPSSADDDDVDVDVEKQKEKLRETVVRDLMMITSTSSTSTSKPTSSSSSSPSFTSFVSPFEWKAGAGGDKVHVPLVYCDFTASHRPSKQIENYLHTKCIPWYGNTHTNTSITGSQSTAFCSEARQLIGEYCGAKTTGKASKDVVLFA